MEEEPVKERSVSEVLGDMETKACRAMPDRERELLPIAETFDSIQGEGQYAGHRMYFIRFAGCPVGKPLDPSSPYEICKPLVGDTFTCDTNYQFKHLVPMEHLLGEIPKEVKHVSLTGGEPLVQKHLMSLITHLHARHKMVHIETSGVVEKKFGHLFRRPDIWLTVSPKDGCKDSMIKQADQLKIIVGPGFDIDKLPESVMNHKKVYLLPISGITQLRKANVDLAIEIIMKQKSEWILTTQIHKIWGVR